MTDKLLEWLNSKVMFGEVNDEQKVFALLEKRILAADELARRCEHQNLTAMCRAALDHYKDACK